MMRRTALLLLLPLLPLTAQEKPPERTLSAPDSVYRVEYRIRDGSDAAARNGRRYAMLIANHNKATFKLGERVPVATGSFQPGVGGVGVNPLVNTQFTYLDIGVNIDAHLDDNNGRIILNSTLDISTLVEHKPSQASQVLPNPTVAQIRIAEISNLATGKPTLVASIDDPVTQRKFDVEVTVTKVD
jgi:hypothetical protein